MRTEHKLVFISALLGLSVWVADAVVDYLFFREGTFWELLIYRVPAHDILVRLAGVVSILILASIIPRVLGRSKRAEEALQQSEEKYRTLVETASDFIYMIDEKGKVLSLNESAARLFGKKPEEIMGKSIFALFPNEIATAYSSNLQGVFRTGRSLVSEQRMIAEGKEMWISTNLNPVKDREDRVRTVLGITRDLTERKKAEEALKLAHIELNQIFNNAADGMRLVDKDFNMLRSNATFCSLSGVSGEEVAGRKCYEVFHSHLCHTPDCALTRILEGEECVVCEVEKERNDGLKIPCILTATPFRRADGELIGIVEDFKDITERKKAEEALRESEEFSSNLLSNSPNPMLVINEDSSVRYVNPALEKLTGFSSAEVIGAEAPYPWWTEETLQKTSADLREAMRKGAKGLEELFRKKNGERFWVEITSVAVRSNGKFRYYLANWVDITESKKAEQALLESEEKYRLVSENIPVVVYSALPDEHSTTTLVSGRILELTGYSHEEFIEHAQLWTQIVHPDDRDYVWRKMEEHREKMAPLDVEYRIITKDNTVKWIRDKATPMVDENGQMIRIDGFMEDITEHKRAEDELRLFSHFVECSCDGVAMGDLENRITYANKAFVRMFGYSQEELIGREIYSIYAENQLQKLEAALRATREGGWTGELIGRRKDGGFLLVEVSSSRVLDEEGKVVAHVASHRDITERKKAEEAIRESEEKHRTLVENLPQKIFYKDRGSVYVSCNKNYARDLKIKPEEITGKTDYDFYPKDLADKYRGDDRRLMESAETEEIEEKYIQDGKEVIVQTVKTPVRDEWGNVVGILGIFWDITERKRAEEALRETTDYLDNLIEHANAPIIVWDPGFKITRFNRAFEHLTGYTAKEVIGQELSLLFPEGSRGESLRKIERTSGGEYWESVEIPILRKDGGIRIALWNSANIYAEDGRTLLATIAQGHDITERKKAEEAIQQSEEKHRTLVENLPQRIFYKDRDSIYVSCNKNYASDLGIKPDEIAGKTDYDFYPKELAEKYRADDRRLMESEETEDIEERYIQHGKELTIHTVKTPVRDEEGNVVGILGIFWDITEQRSLEAQLRQSQKMESLGTLAGGVAHDFNNLLGGILGYVGLIKGDYSAEDKHYAMLELVEKAGVRAAELTNQLLAFSRKGKYEQRTVDLNNSVEDVLKLIRGTLDKNIEIATKLQEELLCVEGDPGQLEQAILNLCVNAAEAMPGGGKLHLETRVVALEEEFTRKYLGSDPGDYVLLSVSDTGIGMDSETLSRMFEPFFTTKEVGKGTGLGLSTVYGIVKNHGGYVDVRSQPGKGSTFDIYLPASKEEFTPGQPRTPELKGGRETILAVDDEEIIRSLLKETLEKLGYKVILANEGEEAIQIYEEKRDEIDAVIIDMIMPRVGGCEAFQEMKRRNPGVKVLLATGYSQDGTAQQILDEGVKGFIQKPFDLVELSQKLRQVLD